MSINLIWKDKALNFVRKLGKIDSKRIVEKMKDIRLNPERYVLSLVNMNVSKIRVGDYRIFVNFYKDKNELVIHSVRHRRNAYKR